MPRRATRRALALLLHLAVLAASMQAVAQAPPAPTGRAVSTAQLIEPFAPGPLADALGRVRAHVQALGAGLTPPPGGLAAARADLRAALEARLTPTQAQAATLLTLRLLALDGQHAAAAMTAAVGRLAIPALHDALTLDLVAHLVAGEVSDAALPVALVVGLDAAALPRADLVAASALARAGDGEAAARRLVPALLGEDEALREEACARAPAALPRLGASIAGARLIGALRAACVGAPAALAAEVAWSAHERWRAPGLDAATRAALAAAVAWDAPARLVAARRRYALVQHEAVLEAVAPLLDDDRLAPALRCEALWRAAMTWRRSRRASRAREPYERMLEVCDEASLWHARALYGLGWLDFNEGARDAARARFEALRAAHPDAYLADDAALYLVHLAAARRDAAGALEAVAPILDGALGGDVAGEAIWRAYEVVAAEDPAAGRALLERALPAAEADRTSFSAGRVHFALAWADAAAGALDAAAARHAEVLERYPLTHFAYLSLSALRGLAGQSPVADAALAAWDATLEAARAPARPLTLTLADAAEVDAALLLVQGGWGARAAARLARGGLLDGARGWLAALALHLDGEHARAHDLPRRALTGWDRRPPAPDNRLLWEIAYPRPYEALAEGAAARFEVPAALIEAVIREESGFRPQVESYAHAIGLMQLLLPTATWMAERHLNAHAPDPATLRQPPVNVPLGAAYLAHLARTLAPNPTLQAAGYNAGGGRVRGWLRAINADALPWFVEAIPSTQTRDYSKRVTATTFTYRVLYGDGPVAPLPLTLPR